VGLERGPLSLVSTFEVILERKSSGSGLESREYGHGDPLRWPRETLYLQKLALTSLTSGDRSKGIVRSLTKDTELILLLWSWKQNHVKRIARCLYSAKYQELSALWCFAILIYIHHILKSVPMAEIQREAFGYKISSLISRQPERPTCWPSSSNLHRTVHSVLSNRPNVRWRNVHSIPVLRSKCACRHSQQN
jgi:hypothetical protein